MEQTIRVESLRWYPTATAQQLSQRKETLLKEDSATLLVMPNPEDPEYYQGLLLAKYYTGILSTCTGVRGIKMDGPFCCLQISCITVRGFVSSVMRKISPICTVESCDSSATADLSDAFIAQDVGKPTKKEALHSAARFGSALAFLQNKSPAQIQRELDEYVIGQRELTRAVANFLYYHIMRQVHPNLPQRPLLVSGPSGSGKTEVWRVARRLYGTVLPIKIIDGSSLSCEGWSGNYKLDTYIDATLVGGGILVVDEFDKLTRPKHSSRGDNVSLDIQSEFLKLIEGEYHVTENRKQTNMTSEKMGFVLVGAFESLRAQKQGDQVRQVQPIGFCAQQEAPSSGGETLTDEDFIAYGILPEIVGRIATKCSTAPLPDSAYLDILRGPHSRVAQVEQVLDAYGIRMSDVISPQALKELVAASKSNHTGVRWVSAQVETRLLEAIYEQGLFRPCAAAS